MDVSFKVLMLDKEESTPRADRRLSTEKLRNISSEKGLRHKAVHQDFPTC